MCSALLRALSQQGQGRRLALLGQHLTGMSTATQQQPEVLVARDGPLLSLTLNRPTALNSLNLNMARLLTKAMKDGLADPGVVAVVIEGAGPKAFCAGGDIRAVTEAGRSGDPLAQDFFKAEYTLNHMIGTYEKPFIAMQDGITMGGGVGLSVHGDFRIATEHTLFAMPETRIGLFPDVGGGYFLPRLPGALGMYLALTGYRLKSRDVALAGVATHFIPRAQIPLVKEMLIEACAGPGDHHEAIRSCLNSLHHKYSSEHAQSELSLTPYLAAIERCFSQDSVEAIMGSLEAEDSPWSRDTIESLSTMSPTSLKITHRQLSMGAGLSLADCLVMEYRMCQACMANSDFYEGVRALLVDRDNNPKWSPSTLPKVTDNIVNSYFQEPPGSCDLVL